MYPNLYYAFKDLFNIEIPFLKIINTSGFFIALCILIAAWLWNKELKRRQATGELTHREIEVIIGKPATLFQLLSSFFRGFILGYKIVGLLIVKDALSNPQSFIFSLQGSWLAGLIVGLCSVGLKWWEKNSTLLPEPEEVTIQLWPTDWVLRAIILAAISGVAGCKLFYILENINKFKTEQWKSLLSSNGFNYYGGLLLATITLWLYYKKWGIYRMRMADAMAPTLMLAYAIGRIGCQLAGDGDWGIINRNPKPFSWLPNWLWAYDYPHNAIRQGLYIPGCTWDEYCYRLAASVYPTPIYEIIIALILFAVLWNIRKRCKIAGRLSAIYLIFTGLERFFIEKIRVNMHYSILGFHLTQAQIISVVYVIAGIILYALSPKLAINRKEFMRYEIDSQV